MLGERGRSAVEEQHPVGDCGMEMGRDFMPFLANNFPRKGRLVSPAAVLAALGLNDHIYNQSTN